MVKKFTLNLTFSNDVITKTNTPSIEMGIRPNKQKFGSKTSVAYFRALNWKS
jgi:hypothetical protein